MRVAKRALSLEQQAEFFGQQHARKRLAVVALLVALCIREFGQHHFGGGSIAFLAHFVRRGCESLLHLAAFTLCVFVGFLRLSAADPVKAPSALRQAARFGDNARLPCRPRSRPAPLPGWRNR